MPHQRFYHLALLLFRTKNQPFFFTLKKFVIDYIEYNGCARRGASGALFPKSADAGLNSL
jgi:hypothetical protein